MLPPKKKKSYRCLQQKYPYLIELSKYHILVAMSGACVRDRVQELLDGPWPTYKDQMRLFRQLAEVCAKRKHLDRLKSFM